MVCSCNPVREVCWIPHTSQLRPSLLALPPCEKAWTRLVLACKTSGKSTWNTSLFFKNLAASLPLQSPATVLQPTVLNRKPPLLRMLHILRDSPVLSSLFSAAARRVCLRPPDHLRRLALPTVSCSDSSLVVLIIAVSVSSHKRSSNNEMSS
ncbi:hypothetical protein IGI04_034755 [Brassica rapa subsp. trilocularis]|uniref:Uncharacterized protein n=1 Tax=Brassica rapa subsp. trilocularis TaxID=1813537 RepID=A0ABQ7LBM8_BRACM|nr:hypothetical protein IGI04_034755 [Brassica rapa subsp. trilocularis]